MIHENHVRRVRVGWSPRPFDMNALGAVLDGMTRSRVHDAVATSFGVHLPYVYPMQGSTP